MPSALWPLAVVIAVGEEVCLKQLVDRPRHLEGVAALVRDPSALTWIAVPVPEGKSVDVFTRVLDARQALERWNPQPQPEGETRD